MLACASFWVSRYFWNGPFSSTPSATGISTGGRRNIFVYGVGVFLDETLLDLAKTSPPAVATRSPPPPSARAPRSRSRLLTFPRVIELPGLSVPYGVIRESRERP